MRVERRGKRKPARESQDWIRVPTSDRRTERIHASGGTTKYTKHTKGRRSGRRSNPFRIRPADTRPSYTDELADRGPAIGNPGLASIFQPSPFSCRRAAALDSVSQGRLRATVEALHSPPSRLCTRRRPCRHGRSARPPGEPRPARRRVLHNGTIIHPRA
jgi:hypothetical protein